MKGFIVKSINLNGVLHFYVMFCKYSI